MASSFKYSVMGRSCVVALLALLIDGVTCAPTALSVTPSTTWYGDDGSWSAISLRLGSPRQWVDVMVSTVSAETWAVGPYGCNDQSVCAAERGELFDFSKSSTWKPVGFYELDVDTQLGYTGYAEYGLDWMTFGTTGVNLTSTIIGSINTTEYWLGYFGLGIVPGNFKSTTIISPISGLVEKEGAIPSHSYGYTAGAIYQQKGETLSLTLGGYDENRFIPHNVSFELNPSQQPQAYVNVISVASSSSSNNWTTPVQLLSTADRVSAIIDSSTPYLWLPRAVCDRFAETLGLSYNSSLNLYTFDSNPLNHDVLANAQLTFTFNLADLSSTSETINITLPYSAFDLQLSYPAIPNTTYGSSQSTKYYFPLRPATNEAQYTIGRAFLQEAYIITDYERNNFSIHQAVHVADPIGNTSIISITRPSTSTFTGPGGGSSGHTGLATGAIAGVVVGSVAVIGLLAFVTFYFWRRRQQKQRLQRQQQEDPMDDEKPPIKTHRSFLARLLRRPQQEPPVHEASGSTSYPTEVGADATHERFELAAPLGPAELDSEDNTLDGSTEAGTQDSADISAYERARRKLERQRTVGQSRPREETYPVEKNENDISPVPHYRAPEISDIEDQLVSPLGPESGGSLTMSGNPSPVSPGFSSGPISPVSPPPVYRRINPGNAIYAGRLPDNVVLPQLVPRIIGADGRTVTSENSAITEPNSSSLGSQFTLNQTVSDELSGSGSGSGNTNRIADARVGSDGGTDIETQEMLDPWGSRRRLDGEDLIHVPQPAENRYSWEEERI